MTTGDSPRPPGLGQAGLRVTRAPPDHGDWSPTCRAKPTSPTGAADSGHFGRSSRAGRSGNAPRRANPSTILADAPIEICLPKGQIRVEAYAPLFLSAPTRPAPGTRDRRTIAKRSFFFCSAWIGGDHLLSLSRRGSMLDQGTKRTQPPIWQARASRQTADGWGLFSSRPGIGAINTDRTVARPGDRGPKTDPSHPAAQWQNRAGSRSWKLPGLDRMIFRSPRGTFPGSKSPRRVRESWRPSVGSMTGEVRPPVH